MVGEEDELEEEDELLIQAVQEQAQREMAKYQRPPNYPPPVVNLAGPSPPVRSVPRTPHLRVPPKPPPPIEDDEESEVELLSISSEEEDLPPRKPVAAAAADSKQGDKDDDLDDDSDLGWDEDDEEPEAWKFVDEAETHGPVLDIALAQLVRRVREMRETRAAPAASVTRMRRSTTILDVVPRGEDLIDPLGLGMINIKTLTLMSHEESAASLTSRTSMKGKDSAHSEQDAPIVRDPASREKVMYHSEKFDPKFFLARIHQNTAAAALEAGDRALKQDLQNRKEQLKKLVKENFDCFISCKNTIDDIHSKLKQIEADPEGAGTNHLSAAILDVDAVARRAFGPLLERQAQAERIRSVQGLLQRFRTLFNLPSTIRNNISKGDYDLAIREYKKAKSIVLPSHVGILKRVLEEVDKIVQEFKESLYKTMEDPQVEISQLENTIRLLLELEPESDPVWHYLNIQDRRIRGLLEGCTVEHEARMDALHGRFREKVQSDARWKQLQRESNKTMEVDLSLLLDDHDKDVGEPNLKESAGDESDALLGRLIRRLTAVIIRHVPNFWRLALSIFSGKFSKVSQPGSTAATSVQSKRSRNGPEFSAQYPFEEKVVESKYSSHSIDEVVSMVHNIISLYESKVQNAFTALAEATVVRPYMREAVSEISKACLALEAKDAAPPSAVQALLILRTEITKVFILRLCTLMRGATSELVYDEDWSPVPTAERYGSPFAISALPLRFQEMLVSSMEHMKEMIQRLKSEAAGLHEEMMEQVLFMQDSVRFTFFECFLDLADSLEKLSVELSQAALHNEKDSENGLIEDDKFVGLQAGVEVTSPHQRLLMVLSNCGFCKSYLLPELSKKYKAVWMHPGVNQIPKSKGPNDDNAATAEDAVEALTELEEKILEMYTSSKASVIGLAAASYLLDDAMQLAAAPPVKGIRYDVVELLHPLIAVHAEVYAGARPFLQRVVGVLVEGLMQALVNTFGEQKTQVLRSLDINGFCQLMLELDYIEAILRVFLSSPAQEAGVTLRHLFLEKVLELLGDPSETPNHRRGTTRGGDDGIMDERLLHMTPDDLLAHAHQISAEFMQYELRRTRINTICFMEVTSHVDFNAVRRMPVHSNPPVTSFMSQKSRIGYTPSLPTGHRRKNSLSSLSDSESGKMYSSLPPLSPMHKSSSYASSDIGSNDGSADLAYRPPGHSKMQNAQYDSVEVALRIRSTLWTKEKLKTISQAPKAAPASETKDKGIQKPLPYGERTDDEAALPISPLTTEEIAAASLPKDKKKSQKQVANTNAPSGQEKSSIQEQIPPNQIKSQHPNEQAPRQIKAQAGLLAAMKKSLTGGS